jgi:hypothetical protein
MIVTGETSSTANKPCPSATLTTNILHRLTWTRTATSALSGRRLTATGNFHRFTVHFDSLIFFTQTYALSHTTMY